PVPGDLVRQHARGDRLRVLASLGRVAADRCDGVPGNVRDPVRWPAVGRLQEDAADAGPVRVDLACCALAGALPDGHALGVGAQRSAVRTSRARSDAALRWLLPGLLRLVRHHVSDDLAATGDDHAGARSGTLIPGTPEHR